MIMVSSKERSDKRTKHQTSCVVGRSGGNTDNVIIRRVLLSKERVNAVPLRIRSGREQSTTSISDLAGPRSDLKHHGELNFLLHKRSTCLLEPSVPRSPPGDALIFARRVKIL